MKRRRPQEPESSGQHEAVRRVARRLTPWWVWVVAVVLTAAVVFALLDALNTPEPGGVRLPYTLQ